MIEGQIMTPKTWKMGTTTPQVHQTPRELEDIIYSRGVKITIPHPELARNK